MTPRLRPGPGPGPGVASRPARIALGVLLLARGRVDGFGLFDATSQAFLSSLAPLVAFPLTGGVLMLLGGGGLPDLADLLATICGLLAPPVLSHALARRWGRDAGWLRYATAFNWCQWAMPPVAAVLVVGVSVPAALLHLPADAAAGTALALLLAYALWLHWFLARHGLAQAGAPLGGARAAALVAGVNLGTLLLLCAPRLVAMAAGPVGKAGP